MSTLAQRVAETRRERERLARAAESMERAGGRTPTTRGMPSPSAPSVGPGNLQPGPTQGAFEDDEAPPRIAALVEFYRLLVEAFGEGFDSRCAEIAFEIAFESTRQTQWTRVRLAEVPAFAVKLFAAMEHRRNPRDAALALVVAALEAQAIDEIHGEALEADELRTNKTNRARKSA